MMIQISTGPGGGGGVCWSCKGARACEESRSGSANCKVEADSSGTSCTSWGRCGVGHPFSGDIVLYAAPDRDAESDAVEDRINRYFHEDVIPRLQERWRTLSGEGAIVIRHHYSRKDYGNWVPDALEVFRTSLPEEQTQYALEHMRDAVYGTSFPPDEWDGEEREFVLFWEWPVPLQKGTG